MLKIDIISIGKIKEKYFKDAITEYEKRLSPFVNLKIIELNEFALTSSNSINIVKEKESENLFSYASGFKILLDIEGENLSSLELSKKIHNLQQNNSHISFIIGGSNGVSDSFKEKANFKLSFGKNTYPHQLMRVILLEQIYRAFSIINNSSYHK